MGSNPSTESNNTTEITARKRMQVLCMRRQRTMESSTHKGAKELKHSSKNHQQRIMATSWYQSQYLKRRRIALNTKHATKLSTGSSIERKPNTKTDRITSSMLAYGGGSGSNFSGAQRLLVQPDEGVSDLVVDRIGVTTAIYREEPGS
ncbi:hypothetical protein F511_39160 [Dorcoceras hygrometricum]|uniref:Uncharacterized protein n=1 Tax=Dorcoceras hygrometricum TaxID=472368 RepID=A0A2Z7CHN9_9LAMI|nr:hypothetical protein F511_39160 [Dorcoceras hygrometricum]